MELKSAVLPGIVLEAAELEQEENGFASVGRREGGYENKPEKRVWKVFVHGYDGQVQTECKEEGTQVILENG